MATARDRRRYSRRWFLGALGASAGAAGLAAVGCEDTELPPEETPTPEPTPEPTRVAATDRLGPPPFPLFFSGSATIGGEAAPDGTKVFARIAGEAYYGGLYSSGTVEVINGRYSSLNIGPPSVRYFGLDITFHTVIDDREVQAAETTKFSMKPIEKLFGTLDLTFASP